MADVAVEGGVDVARLQTFNRGKPGDFGDRNHSVGLPPENCTNSATARLVGHLGTTTVPLAREQAGLPSSARLDAKLDITLRASLFPTSTLPPPTSSHHLPNCARGKPRRTMSATATTTLPAWAAGLKNPPAHKSKQAGIPDPPGYPSSQSPSNSKVEILRSLHQVQVHQTDC
jgi:hypothetical protein